MRAIIYKIASVAMAALVVLIFGFYIVSFNRTSMQTARVEEITVSDTVSAEGVFVRDEQTVTYNGAGYLVYEVESGKKVASGQVIASAYPSESLVSKHILAAAAQQRVDTVERAQSSAQYSISELADIEHKLYNLYAQLSALAAHGRADRMRIISEEINYLLCRKQMVMANDAERIRILEELRAEVNETGITVAVATAPDTGYFVSSTDGYEAVLNVSVLETLTPEYIQNLKNYTPGTDSKWIGKIVTDYKWYFAAVLTDEQAQNIRKGDSLKVDFPFLNILGLDMSVENIIASGGKKTVVMSCTTVKDVLLLLRGQVAALTKTTIRGLKIDFGAVRMLDDRIGVYAVRNGVLKFFEIDPIYRADDYYIIAWNDSNEKNIMLYDEIIIGGRDLQEGQLVK